MTLGKIIAQTLAADTLTEALEIAKTHVKTHPSDQDARGLYIDLLILAGDYERADAQCALSATLATADAVGFAMLRGELRAMAARKAWFEASVPPTFPRGPSDLDKAAIFLNLAHRGGARNGARDALSAIDDLRGKQPMIWGNRQVADFRDLDDRLPHALEVLTTGGAYLWVDFATIAAIDPMPIGRPRDLAFRRAQLALVDGSSASVLLPAIYYGSSDKDTLLLGRETAWVEEDSGITTGRGQRCFLAGDDLVCFHDATHIASIAPSGQERRSANG